ncbi:hypothetical protein C8Q79DRAFT_128719 [Trametes meyenii]|nr:hypothetical protein C8Q79DRAFT_128719 [Trametes meyenii]
MALLQPSAIDYSELGNRAGACSTPVASPRTPSKSKESRCTQAVDVEFVQKILHRERVLRELDRYWDHPFERSDSIGICPDVVHAPLKRKATFADENKPLKRVKVDVADAVQSSPPHAFIDFSVAGPSSQPSSAPMSAKALGKQRAVHVSDDDTEQSSPAAPQDVNGDVKPSIVEAVPEPDLEGKEENEEYVRCRWNGCTKMIARAAYKAHLDAGHAGQLTAAKRSYTCTWGKCKGKADTHSTMERHLRTVHYAGKVHMCPQCSRGFNRRDALQRHLDRASCKLAKVDDVDSDS